MNSYLGDLTLGWHVTAITDRILSVTSQGRDKSDTLLYIFYHLGKAKFPMEMLLQ
ncbi:MAG: hypothetical protein JOZ78_23655 [Chroococcidiopsidaceae cyanobacterium CP_BM_ER_R8_30]|nr:hypothetical protein [Chroococcidiopsidaceae cyanobacterium CP_BM_ER_R8_30]